MRKQVKNNELGERCRDCDKLLNDFEADLSDLYDGFCEDCFEKNIEAHQAIFGGEE